MAEGILNGVRVLDFSHMLAGPLAARRLADLGARVVKVEPPGGEGLRHRGLETDKVDGEHLRFHAYNGGKESIELDLKVEADREAALLLALGADVIVQNFRPGVLAKFGLGFEELRIENPGLVYASVSGYGSDGPWHDDPGQDLLVQARSGLMWLNGRHGDRPTPVGAVVADIATANILVQGILAALLGRLQTGRGAQVETSLLECSMELQIDSFPMYLHRAEGPPRRSTSGDGAHPYVDAPYGVYATADGYIAVASLSEPALAELLGGNSPNQRPGIAWEDHRDRRLIALAEVFRQAPSAYWLPKISALKGWAVEVLDWDQLTSSPSFSAMGLTTPAGAGRGAVVLNAPLRIDGRRPSTGRAPRPGEDTERLKLAGWG